MELTFSETVINQLPARASPLLFMTEATSMTGKGRTLRGVGDANGTLVAFAGRIPGAGVF